MHPCDLTWLPKAVACALRFGRKSVAKQRIVNTKFWDDSYILNLKPIEKLIFLYLLTNPLTNISGVYELPLERVAFDIGISREKIDGVFKKLEADRKLVLSNGWVGIVNFIKHQTLNPKVKQGIMAELKRAPKEIVEKLAIDYRSLSIADDGLSHSTHEDHPRQFVVDGILGGMVQHPLHRTVVASGAPCSHTRGHGSRQSTPASRSRTHQCVASPAGIRARMTYSFAKQEFAVWKSVTTANINPMGVAPSRSATGLIPDVHLKNNTFS
jgi:hypothetical protein